MQNAFLSGEKVVLRALEKGDAPLIAPWINDPEVRRTLLIHRPISRLAEEEFLQAMGKDPSEIHFGLCTRQGRLVGVCGLSAIDTRHRNACFGVFIGDKRFWGKGLGTEATVLVTRYAFETLNLHRVWLEVLESNLAGLKAYERAGYQREGLLRQDHFVDGEYRDTVLMAALRPDWSAPPRKRARRR